MLTFSKHRVKPAGLSYILVNITAKDKLLTNEMLKQLVLWFVSLLDFDEPSVMWMFPYFLEARMRSCLPQFVMLDYKVGTVL